MNDGSRTLLQAQYIALAKGGTSSFVDGSLKFRAEPLRDCVSNKGISGELFLFGVFSHLDPMGLEPLAIKSAHVPSQLDKSLDGGSGLYWNTHDHLLDHVRNLAFVRMHVEPIAVQCKASPELCASWNILLDQCIEQYSVALQEYSAFPVAENKTRIRVPIRMLPGKRPLFHSPETFAREQFLVLAKERFGSWSYETLDGRVFICVVERASDQVALFLPVHRRMDGKFRPITFCPPGGIPLDVPPRFGPLWTWNFDQSQAAALYCLLSSELESITCFGVFP